LIRNRVYKKWLRYPTYAINATWRMNGSNRFQLNLISEADASSPRFVGRDRKAETRCVDEKPEIGKTFEEMRNRYRLCTETTTVLSLLPAWRREPVNLFRLKRSVRVVRIMNWGSGFFRYAEKLNTSLLTVLFGYPFVGPGS